MSISLVSKENLKVMKGLVEMFFKGEMEVKFWGFFLLLLFVTTLPNLAAKNSRICQTCFLYVKSTFCACQQGSNSNSFSNLNAACSPVSAVGAHWI